jgi:hypothetical protein
MQFRGLQAQAEPVAEIVQCGEPILSITYKHQPSRGQFSVPTFVPPLRA